MISGRDALAKERQACSRLRSQRNEEIRVFQELHKRRVLLHFIRQLTLNEQGRLRKDKRVQKDGIDKNEPVALFERPSSACRSLAARPRATARSAGWQRWRLCSAEAPQAAPRRTWARRALAHSAQTPRATIAT